MNRSQNQSMNNSRGNQSFYRAGGVGDMVNEEYKDGSKYEGEKRHGQRHGKGKFTYPDGAAYDG